MAVDIVEVCKGSVLSLRKYFKPIHSRLFIVIDVRAKGISSVKTDTGTGTIIDDLQTLRM